MVVTVIAAALVFYDLGDKQLRLDEATSWFIAKLDWNDLWEAISTSEANASVYYALLHLWIGLGESESVIRALSALFGIATIPVVYALGYRLFGRLPALVAALFLSVNAFYVANVQDARGYAMATFLITVTSLLFVDLLWRPAAGRIAAYVVLGTLAIYAHFFSALVLAAHLASVLVAERRPSRQLAAAYGAIALAVSPLVYFTITNDVGQIDWIPEPSGTELAKALSKLTGDAGPVLAVGYGIALALAAAAIWKLPGRRSFDGWRYAFVLLWAVAPVLVAFGLSFVKPIFMSRYLMIAMPGIALGAAAGLARLRERLALVAGAAVVATIIVSSLALTTWYEDPGIRWTPRVEQLAQAEPDDGMVFYSPTTLRPYLYYATQMNVMDDLPELVYPASFDWPGYSRTRYDPDLAAIARSASEHDRMWLIAGVTFDEPRQEEFRTLRTTLLQRCPEVAGDYRRPRVILYGNCA